MSPPRFHNTPQNARDRATLDLLRRGEPRGLEQLVNDHGGVVRAYLKNKFSTELEDWQRNEAISLAVIRVWESAPRIEPEEGTLRARFAVLARNRAVLQLALRDESSSLTLGDETACEQTGVGAAFGEHDLVRLQLLVDVERCLRLLPDLQQAVLVADLNAATTLPAIILADRFQVTSLEVDTGRSAGRRQLRKMLVELGHSPTGGQTSAGGDEYGPANSDAISPRKHGDRRP